MKTAPLARILIVVQGGVVTEVRCTDPDAGVTIIDLDALDPRVVEFRRRAADAMRTNPYFHDVTP